MQEITDFRYNNELYNLFDIIDKDKDFIGSNENEDSLNIIKKNGILKLCKHFGFKDDYWEIVKLEDTHDWGTIMIVRLWLSVAQKQVIDQTGSVKDEESDGIEKFCGDGEVNKFNFTQKEVCFPLATCLARARSRAVLLKLGIYAYGEDEAEAFSKLRKNPANKFTANKNALPIPPINKQIKTSDTKPDVEKIKNEYRALKEFAQKSGITENRFMAILKVAARMEKGIPGLDEFLKDPNIFSRAKTLIQDDV